MTTGFTDPTHAGAKTAKRHLKLAVLTIAILAIVSSGIHAGWAVAFDGRIYPGVHLDRTHLGGLTREEAVGALQERFTNLVSKGVTFSVNGASARMDLYSIAESDPDLSRGIIDADIEAAVAEAYAFGRSSNVFINLFLVFLPTLERPNLTVPLTMDRDDLSRRILSAFPTYDVEPAPTKFLIHQEPEGWRVAVMEGEIRTTLNLEAPLSMLEIGFSRLDEALLSNPITVPLVTLKPDVSLEEAVEMIPAAEAVLAASPFTLAYADDDDRTFSWELKDEDLANLLVPAKSGLGLEDEALRRFFEPIEVAVNVEAQDARFTANGSRAETFIPSRAGRQVDTKANAEMLEQAVLSLQSEPAQLVVSVTKPGVALEEANDLGIKERLGTGVSSYAGSPPNRIKNIRNGVRLLNGLLIPPGETFSLLNALAPFTTENGYLPELVIKGDKIIPEIGGGLCQIGSTTFRAVMNAGLEVTERRNHSLVVTYYNDPSNGNPGTDATIYSPSPDFKFVNNTETYLLFEAVMDEREQKLFFSFWGTSDGRKGWYDPPVVEKWFGAGETRTIETMDIPAGTTKCQSAHPGANASFTYHVRLADGTQTDRVFTSRYRSLPKVCLVGVEALPDDPAKPETVGDEEAIPASDL